MLFHELQFFLFFPAVVALHFLARRYVSERWQWVVLLAASYYFYAAWKPEYLLLIVGSTVVDYAVGLALGRTKIVWRRRALLAASLIVNLGVLFAFKYLDFFGTVLEDAFAAFNVFYEVPAYDLLLPVGISFYTFQTLSYSVDVYREARAPETHFGRFALFVSFFPQLVAGPIERSSHLLPQLVRPRAFDRDRALSGLGLMLWGLFKKLVVADRAALFVNGVYDHPELVQGPTLVLATYAFAFQIYGDFSGYSDIAVGAARVLGVDLMENFRRPYSAVSIADFWRRWHISLSTWFRDYVYIPLGGNQVTAPRLAFNVLVVFVVSGLWHGANWTFVAWGAFHGGLLVSSLAVSHLVRRRLALVASESGASLIRLIRVVATFHLVCLGWLIFRAKDMTQVWTMLEQLPITYPRSSIDELIHVGPAPPDTMRVELVVLTLSVAALEGVEWLRRSRFAERITPRWRTLGFASLLVWTLLTALQSHTPFLYFQF